MASPCPAVGSPEHDLVAQIRAGEVEDLRGAWLVDADLSGADLSGLDLSGADLSRANLAGATLMMADFTGATLFEADLSGAEATGTSFREAHLAQCKGAGAGFGRADFTGADVMGACFRGASFTQATLERMDARTADFTGARMTGASLVSSDFTKARMGEVDLEDAFVDRALFTRTDMRSASFRGVRGYPSADWVGADLRHADFCGAYLLRREAIDQNFLWEFRRKSKANAVLYLIWKATSDCGRSVGRWGALTAFIAFTFAAIYCVVPIDFGSDETWLSPLYFSVVTLTTLGYGDALPTDVLSQAVVMTQVVIGYFMLGGLLSIFATKMASRGE